MATISTLTSDEQFLVYYEKLREELNTAYTYYEICKSLREMKVTRRTEFSEALTFFSLTMNATLFATVISIGKFIDTRRDSLHLKTFFEFINKNLSLFSSEAYQKRLMNQGFDKEYCEHFKKLHNDISAEQVQQDSEKIRGVPINNLKMWRDKKLAHIEKDMVTKTIDIMKLYPVTILEIDTILITLHEILNRYRIAFDGVQWILGLPSPKPQIEYIMDSILVNRQSRKIK